MVNLVITGGGTAGHIMPNLALIEELKKNYPTINIHYFGSYMGQERKLLIDNKNVIYHGTNTGKIRRYFSLKNFFDMFRVITGILQALTKLIQIKPKLIFSKGGYVSLPSIIGGAILGIPIIIHESDISPGLTTKIALFFAKEAWCNYQETAEKLKAKNFRGQIRIMKTLVRPEMYKGNKEKALAHLSLNKETIQNKKIILVLGGSSGAQNINQFIDKNIDELIQQNYIVIHVCGQGKLRKGRPYYYFTYEFVNEELPDFLAASDLIISRSGASTLAELAIFSKPTILIPLSKDASRGEQMGNATNYIKEYPGVICEENELNSQPLTKIIEDLLEKNQQTDQKPAQSSVVSFYSEHLAQYLI